MKPIYGICRMSDMFGPLDHTADEWCVFDLRNPNQPISTHGSFEDAELAAARLDGA